MQLKQILIGATLAWAALTSTSGAGVISHGTLIQPAAQLMHMRFVGAAPVSQADTWLMMGLGVALMVGGLALMRTPPQRPSTRLALAV